LSRGQQALNQRSNTRKSQAQSHSSAGDVSSEFFLIQKMPGMGSAFFLVFR
jgi:hypothetical protein